MPFSERIHRTAWSIGVAVLMLATACSEMIQQPHSALHVDASPRKSFVANGDGTYTWDGTSVPDGDASPTQILYATAGGYAPRTTTGGWVAGTMLYDDGDQYKMDLVYSVTNTTTNQPLYSNSATTSGWTYGLSGGEKYYNKDLHLDPMCGYSVTNGGTAYARKALPFRLNIAWLKLPALSALSLGLTTITWGDATPEPMTAFYDAGITCPRAVASVTVSGGTSVSVGQGLSLSATATDNFNASAADLCPSFTWTSSVDSIATVSSSGGVTGVAAGQTTVTAACEGKSGAIGVTVSVPCSQSGEGQVDKTGGIALTRGVNTIRLRNRTALSADCGNQTGTPGSGAGNPPGGAEEHCHYDRDFIIYSDGSWSWLGPWMLHCGVGGEEMRLAPAGADGRTANAAMLPIADKTAPLRVRILGAEKLASGRAVEIHTYPSLDADAEISVNVNTATAADVEAALVQAEEMAGRKDERHIGSLLGAPSEAAMARNGRESRGATYLRSLTSAAKANSRLGNVKVLDITVERTSARTTGKGQGQ